MRISKIYKLPKRFLVLTTLATLFGFYSFGQTVTTTVTWTTGWCNICPPPNNSGNYACAVGSGSGQWNNGIRTFTDPVPAGNIVTAASIQVDKVDCGLTSMTVTLNGTTVQTQPVGFGTNCQCGTCWPQTYANTWPCDTGLPNYVYGGTNTIQLINTGNLCVKQAIITLTYTACCTPSPPFNFDIVGDSTYCTSNPTATFNVSPLVPGAGSYQWVAPPGSFFNGGQGTEQATITFPPGQLLDQLCVYAIDTCMSDTIDSTCMTINVSVNPANAGPNDNICSFDYVLNGNPGLGYWSLISGGGNIQNPNDFSTTVTSLPLGPNVFEWTLDNGICTPTSDQVIITVEPPAFAAFSTPTTCFGDPTTFNDLSTSGGGTIVSWQWDVDNDGVFDYFTQNPTHLFNAIDTHDVTLVVTGLAGCSDTITQEVIVYPNPVAAYTFTSQCDGTPIGFTDQSTITDGSIVSWKWDFGDGSNPVTTQNPTYTYATAGTYPVELTVTSDQGCTSTLVQSVDVFYNPDPAFDLGNECVNDTAYFTDSSKVTNANIITWTWDFGDGSGPSLDTNTNHIYTTHGTYNVMLTVTTDQGCVGSITQPIIINPLPVADFDFNNFVCENEGVIFEDLSTIPTGKIAQWDWDFGDANKSNLQNPTTYYQLKGTYDITLVATSDSGCFDDITKSVLVNPRPDASFVFVEDDLCAKDSVAFEDRSVVDDPNGIISTVWDMADGSGPLFGTNVSNRFQLPGVYQVKVVVSSIDQCKDSATEEVTVRPNPVVEFITNDPLEGCDPVCITYIDKSDVDPAETWFYSWEFTDGTTSGAINPTHCYTTDGENDARHTAKLTITSEFGCTDKMTAPFYVNIHPIPTADFDLSPAITSILEPEVKFTNMSLLGDTYDWTFGDGTTSKDKSPTHVYESANRYIVKLVTTSEHMCVDSTDGVVQINRHTALFIPSAFTPNEDDINEVFYAKGENLDYIELIIFDRWGNELFRGENENAKWDGTFKGKVVDSGTYAYSIKYKFIGGNFRDEVGKLQVSRANEEDN